MLRYSVVGGIRTSLLQSMLCFGLSNHTPALIPAYHHSIQPPLGIVYTSEAAVNLDTADSGRGAAPLPFMPPATYPFPGDVYLTPYGSLPLYCSPGWGFPPSPPHPSLPNPFVICFVYKLLTLLYMYSVQIYLLNSNYL